MREEKANGSRQVPAPSTDTKASCSDKNSHLSWSSASTFRGSAGFVSFYSFADPTAAQSPDSLTGFSQQSISRLEAAGPEWQLKC